MFGVFADAGLRGDALGMCRVGDSVYAGLGLKLARARMLWLEVCNCSLYHV